MYNVIHDVKEETIQQLVVQINQIDRALQIDGLCETTRNALHLDLEELLTKYHYHTGQYFFAAPRSKVVRLA